MDQRQRHRVLLTFLQQFNGIDLTPIYPFVPDKYEGLITVTMNSLPMVISLLGWMVERLRNKTTMPLELVAVPDKVVANNPVVAETIAAADAAKAQAVIVATVATAEAKAS